MPHPTAVELKTDHASADSRIALAREGSGGWRSCRYLCSGGSFNWRRFQTAA